MQSLDRAICLLFALFMAFASTEARGQRYTISGTVSAVQSGEALIGANVSAVSLELGTASNNFGFYSLTLPETDSLAILFSHVGFEPQIKKVYLVADIVLNVGLVERTADLDQVTVTAERVNAANVGETRMGVVDVPIQAVERLPAIPGGG